MSIRVLHVMLEPRMGGPQLRVLGLAEGLRAQGIDTSIVLPDGPAPFRSYLDARGFQVFQLPLHRLRWSRSMRTQLETAGNLPFDLEKLVRLFRAIAPDVVHAHGLFQVQGAIAARLCGIPLVWHLNDLLLPRPLVRALAPLVLALAQAVVTVSQAVRHYMFGHGAVHRKLVTIYDPPVRVGDSSLAVSEPQALPAEWGPQGARVLTVGNLYRVKGHADLLRAAAQVTRPASFLLVGAPLDSQPEVAAELERLRGELSLTRRVFLLGWREAVASYYEACDLYVHPSRSEACPLAVLEAMAAGRAVVATAAGGVPELVRSGGMATGGIRAGGLGAGSPSSGGSASGSVASGTFEPVDGETGLLVPVGDAAGMARAIDALLSDPERREAMGRRGRALIDAKFSLETCTARHAALYRAVAGGLEVAAAVDASR